MVLLHLFQPSIIVFTTGGSDGKESAYNVGDLDWTSGLGRRRAKKPTPVFLPGDSPRTGQD